ncbi:MAG TPA: conjugative transposon protein TraJ [Puia sp.]|uniref:conjugative transposon protein TraJ n=1 Tax=Puia sp. TaxID=2045100 RepID=UPI002BFA95EC|nr:conjugative transposon protein TraJ [Puia sp.]HVU97744.1 conjugative transposon protein TraJ [Puia sp.]
MKYALFLGQLLLICLLLPVISFAQTDAGIGELHGVLQNVYRQMIPLCEDLLQVSRAIAGFGTTFYIGVRVWRHIARAEAIDVFPLFRPFAIVGLIALFPNVLSLIDQVLSPTVTATAALVEHSNDAVNNLLAAETIAITTDNSPIVMPPMGGGNTQAWDKYAQPGSTAPDNDSGGGFWSAIGSGFKFIASSVESAFRFIFQLLMSVLLRILYFAASLCIDTIRTFHMVVLAIMGPLAFAFSCYDGFQHSLTNWLARYINIYLWLPVANLFGAILGKIQENMLQIDLARIQSGTATLFSATDLAYLIFLLIGIVGYTTVPSIANYIIHTHGPNPLAQKVTALGSMAVTAASGGAAGGAGGMAAGAASGGGSGGGYETTAKGQPYDPYQFSRDKISG